MGLSGRAPPAAAARGFDPAGRLLPM